MMMRFNTLCNVYACRHGEMATSHDMKVSMKHFNLKVLLAILTLDVMYKAYITHLY
jgi:hypothetical protein